MLGASDDEASDGFLAQINIIPLVDVVLVLLIIFMVTTAFSRDSALRLDLPKGSSAQQLASDPPVHIQVSVLRGGKILVLGEPTALNALNGKVLAINRKHKAIIVLRGERQVAYGAMMPVIDELCRTGLPITMALQPVAPVQ
jgi:biopolymer transport protein ExbD